MMKSGGVIKKNGQFYRVMTIETAYAGKLEEYYIPILKEDYKELTKKTIKEKAPNEESIKQTFLNKCYIVIKVFFKLLINKN